MKKSIWPVVLSYLFLLVMMTIPFRSEARAPRQEYYVLKIYHLDNGSQVSRMDAYLKNAYLPALHHLGIAKVGVFKPVGEDTAKDKRIYVLIPVNSMEEYAGLYQKLERDKRYQQEGSDYINASYDNAPYKRIETIIMKAFPEHPRLTLPDLKNPPSKRIYELRSYWGPTEKYFHNKVHMFNYGSELSIFKKYHFNAVFYASVLAGPHMPNLMYLTTYEDMASRDLHWKEFSSDPKWKQLVNMKKYQHNVTHVVDLFLHPTGYSDI